MSIHSSEAPQGSAGSTCDDGCGLRKFERVAEDLRRQITDGTLKPGCLLPSHAELMKVHQASSLTVQKAVRLLKNEGHVVARQGRGTFVAHAGLARAPRLPDEQAEPLTEFANVVRELHGVLSGMAQLLKELNRGVSALEGIAGSVPEQRR
ncbi:GntR family transcriptional regulator [Streptomyces sp. bgisy060]|uniref:GntR family transcriptional regulator n=1 Tax=Streptomyces sp. bgisy060 TaxID=3413775 RepID=UPI003EBCC1A5